MMFISNYSDIPIRPSMIIDQALADVYASDAFQRWKAQPNWVLPVLTWIIADRDKARLTRTSDGANYHLSAIEIMQADARDELYEWTQEQFFLHLNYACAKFGLEPIR